MLKIWTSLSFFPLIFKVMCQNILDETGKCRVCQIRKCSPILCWTITGVVSLRFHTSSRESWPRVIEASAATSFTAMSSATRTTSPTTLTTRSWQPFLLVAIFQKIQPFQKGVFPIFEMVMDFGAVTLTFGWLNWHTTYQGHRKSSNLLQHSHGYGNKYLWHCKNTSVLHLKNSY